MSQLQSPRSAEQAAVPAVGEAPSPPGRLVMRMAIAFAAIVFVFAVGVLYYWSWLKAPTTPSAMLVVRADEAYDGAVVRLQGPRDTFIGTLLSQNQFICSFHVPPGRYTLSVMISGVTVQEGSLNVGEYQYREVSITRRTPAGNAGPTTGPT